VEYPKVSDMHDTEPAEPLDRHTSRLQLVWDVTAFQFKLLFDGLRDLLLSPLSIGAAILGLIAGGDDPQQYFRRLLNLGRRSEMWLNLFGYRKHGNTSDQMVAKLREKVFDEARSNPWVSRAGTRLNERLDSITGAKRPPEEGGGP
jgi:hypothetical protein